MKNILFLCFNATWHYHFTTKLEIIKNLLKKNENVYILSCDNILTGGCISNRTQSYYRCKKCKEIENYGLNLIGFPKNKILKMQKFPLPEFPNFKTINELKSYTIDDINLGFGVVNACMYDTRDYLFDLKRQSSLIKKSLEFSYLVYKNIEKITKEKNIEEVYIFNGRFAESYAALNYCKNNKIDYYVHERGCDSSKYEVLKNKTFHVLKDLKSEMVRYWECGDKNKEEIAKKWFEDKIAGRDWISYTKNQNKNLLPDNFDKTKTNIAIFNSSLDEYAAFDDWKNYICEDENKIIENLMEYFKNDDSKHFYLRIHPNLKNINTTQMKQLNKLKEKNIKNWTIINPDEKIDTYALLLNSSKVLAFTSTVGLESCYLGIPAILAGRAIYEDLDVAHKALDFDNLIELINTKLPPKQKSNAYPEAYYMATFGAKFKNFNKVDRERGAFIGLNGIILIISKIKDLINFYKITIFN